MKSTADENFARHLERVAPGVLDNFFDAVLLQYEGLTAGGTLAMYPKDTRAKIRPRVTCIGEFAEEHMGAYILNKEDFLKDSVEYAGWQIVFVSDWWVADRLAFVLALIRSSKSHEELTNEDLMLLVDKHPSRGAIELEVTNYICSPWGK